MKKQSWTAGMNRRLGTILFLVVIALAAFMRFYQLGSLPPGLHPSEAHWAMLSGQFRATPSFGALFGGQNLGFALHIATGSLVQAVWKSLQAVRYLSALWGVLAVVGLYFWTKDWFGRRAALLAALFMAVSPWAVTFARNNWPVNLALVALVWLCYFAGRAYKTRHWGYVAASIAAMAVGCTSARVFWIVPALFLITVLVLAAQGKLGGIKKLLAVGVGLSALFALVSFTLLLLVGKTNPAAGLLSANLPQASQSGATKLAKMSIDNIGKTALMFFYHGDEDYSRNLGGLPMLNAFAGLMFLLGGLVALKYRHKNRYMFLVVGLGVTLLPTILGARVVAPDAYRAVLAMPFVFVLVAVGANYLLTRWYTMFPVNTTARTLGLSFVLALMFLTFYQGYRQYFVAWAQDPQTFVAYREDLVAAARYQASVSAKTVIIANPDEAAVVAAVRASSSTNELTTDLSGLEQLPLASKPSQVIIPNSGQAELIKQHVSAKYPGGSYGQELSPFDDRILFFWYKTK